MSALQFNVDRWLLEIMGFANRSAPKCISKFGMNERTSNATFMSLLITEGQNVLEGGDSFIPEGSIKYSFEDIHEARLQCIQFFTFMNLEDPTEETVAKLLQLPASLRKIITYYEDVVAMYEVMQKKEDTQAKSFFAESFHKAHGQKFGATELHYLMEHAERSRIILADATDFINRLEQAINPENYPLRSPVPSVLGARPS